MPYCDAISKIISALETAGWQREPLGPSDDSRTSLSAHLCEAVALSKQGYNLFPDPYYRLGHATNPSARFPHNPHMSLLYAGIIFGDLALVRTQLESPHRPFDINADSPVFGRPLDLAVTHERLDMIQYLMNHGARAGWPTYIELHKISPALRAIPPRAVPARWPLYRACITGNIRVVELILANIEGVWKPAYDDWSIFLRVHEISIIAAAERGYTEVVQFLLGAAATNGASKKYMGKLARGAMVAASFHGEVAVVEMLLEAAVPFCFHDETSLQAAVLGTQKDMLVFLLSRGAGGERNHCRGVDAQSALSLAIEAGHLDMVELLLAHGSDINGDGLSGCSTGVSNRSIYVAALYGRVGILRLLLKGGADLQVKIVTGSRGMKTTVGEWALRNAVSKGFVGVMICLLEAGVSSRHGDSRLDPRSVAEHYRQKKCLEALDEVGVMEMQYCEAQ